MAAGQGAVSEAIATALAAAERAAAKGQFAAEVMCLQTATQFGDRSCVPRLTELASIVEGLRVGLAARFASVLHDGDAAELVSASDEFEKFGDVLAAVDAAAHAALAYRDEDRRGSALGCSDRAAALAQRSGGAADFVGAHRREPHLPRDGQDRNRQPRGVGRIAEPHRRG